MVWFSKIYHVFYWFILPFCVARFVFLYTSHSGWCTYKSCRPICNHNNKQGRKWGAVKNEEPWEETSRETTRRGTARRRRGGGSQMREFCNYLSIARDKSGCNVDCGSNARRGGGGGLPSTSATTWIQLRQQQWDINGNATLLIWDPGGRHRTGQ